MLSSESLSRYREGMEALGDGAARYVEDALADAVAANPELTVSDLRELAIATMEAAVEQFGEMSSALACELYDMQAGEGSSASTIQRVTATSSAERVARYQAGRLADGDLKSFSRACGDYVSDCVRRVAGQTIMDNCRRSSTEAGVRKGGPRRRYRHSRRANGGVRFARIPQGGDTCTFCAMLASRGFVYWSAETAGKFDHFHRGCRCLVVADADGAAEGYDPAEWADRWRAFEEVDADPELTGTQRDGVKSLIASRRVGGVEEAKARWREEAASFEARLDVVDSGEYKEAISAIFGPDLAKVAWKDIRHTLKVKSGQPHESLYAYDLRAGRLITLIADSPTRLSVEVTPSMRAKVAKAVSAGGEVVLMHNHPGSGMPSIADVVSLSGLRAKFGVIACHDGSIIRFSAIDQRYAGYTAKQAEIAQDDLGDFVSRRSLRGKSEVDIFAAVRNEWGIEIERIRFD